ncbi:Acetyltransferase (GNAT) family [uncultured Clostridium sp.]|uniref:GNAT family N-acetyltransferase n=1 Tax=Enterocloster citroniae TaxID=358743 RepID=UPI000820BA2B|nr:GNAT family N-acetyltransferase [Enterocloster citroniae]MCB7067249.1 GNAT family N-acetyltransferase [Enterocloster citroniae]SCI63566.1 Acetyltransferase (GNAT) family [uncultured Clostridium sp.]SFS23399.1 Acetyltransferase (GNAT) domain-containing protein [Enterocloster citroniae]
MWGLKKTDKRSNQVWPGSYDNERMQKAIDKTINITAWDHDKLVGCIRILSDGYLFGTISEILVLKEYRKQGIGRELMDRAADISPTSLFFGAQPEAEGFYERLNIEKSLQSFMINKSKG